MKRFLAIVLMLLWSPASAGPFEDGLQALQSGNFADARAAFAPLAAQGHGNAQFMLGVMFENGLGTAKDRGAAAQGHSRAQNNLGTMYYTGAGTVRDPVEAWKWLTLAVRGLAGDAKEIATQNIAAIERELSPDALEEAKRQVAAWRPQK